ncbi:MAG: hypothetical protein AB2A00_09130 [Myxococcota bacterium]
MRSTRILGLTTGLLALAACQEAPESLGSPAAPSGSTNHPDDTTPSLQLAAVVAHAAGRTGGDLHLRVSGSNPRQQALTLVVALHDGAGAPILAVDGDLDGTLDGSELRLALEETTTDLDHALMVPRLLVDVPGLREVAVRLEDAGGGVSSVVTAPVQEQPELAPGSACEPDSFVTGRCPSGMGCRGTPTVCTEGMAPQLTQVAYHRHDEGPRILVRGTDVDGDIARVRLEFMDLGGAPVLLDLDNDEVPESSSFEVEAASADETGSFLVSLQGAVGLDEEVLRVAATPVDSLLHEGTRLEATLANPPVRSRGQSCDLSGFDLCATGSVCVPNAAATAGVCQDVASVRNRVCGGAPALAPLDGVTTLVAATSEISAWDAPPGCAAHDPTGRPEGVVVLHLSAGVAELTLSTQSADTDFDTVLYVLGACGSGAPLACNDDGENTVASMVTLREVPAGDHVVVVDSWSTTGGTFRLTATVP